MVCVQTTASCRKVKRLGECRHYFMVVTCVLESIVCLGLIFVCWCDFLCLGEILLPWVIYFGYAVTWCLTSSLYGCRVNLGMIFFSVLDEFFVLVGFCLSWCHFTPWCNQPNLGMIFLRFGYNFRFSEILFLLVSLDILVWFTASWYDLFHFARLFGLGVILFDLV